ncbi:hypothetical protein [Garciella nitratireducens]|uniref:hypothetical protein n=1 Tax=Garciella nitratireducens TaxID=218205 RepID=UPI001BD503B8|nr:hypothetical protein [Garciella nitratireducens]
MQVQKKLIHSPLTLFSKNSTSFLKLAIALFYIIPILFLSYLYLFSIKVGEPFFSPILEQPMFTVLFIIAMLNPFYGLFTKIALTDFENNQHIFISRWILKILSVCLLLIGNFFISFLLIIALIKQRKEKSVLNNSFDLKEKGAKSRVIGMIFICSFTLMCFFLLIKIQSL